MQTIKPDKTSALIRDLRQQLNLSQEKFAARVGVSFKTVNRWENGHTTPSPMALKLIQTLLHTMGQSGKTFLNQYFLDEESER